MQFGRKSEKLDRQIEQLELRLEELEADEGAAPVEIPKTPRAAVGQAPRKPLPEHLLREIDDSEESFLVTDTSLQLEIHTLPGTLPFANRKLFPPFQRAAPQAILDTLDCGDIKYKRLTASHCAS